MENNNETMVNKVMVCEGLDDVSESFEVGEELPPTLTMKQVKKDLVSQYEKKKSKPTVEETHIRTTFLFDRKLSARLNKVTKNKRGYKTLLINKAIEVILDELEN